MKENKIPVFDLLFLVIGELIISLVICLVYILLDKFTLSVVLGGVLGCTVAVVNLLVLIFTLNRAMDNAIKERGTEKMDEEEEAKFVQDHKASIQAAAKISYVIRMISIAAALILALLIRDVFDVISTVIPLLMIRPLLTVSQLVKNKMNTPGA